MNDNDGNDTVVEEDKGKRIRNTFINSSHGDIYNIYSWW